MIKMIISCRCGPVLCGVWRRARSGGGRTQDSTPTLLLLLLVKVVFPEIQLIPTSGISSSLNFLCKNLLFCVLSIINIISIINTANIIFVISSFCRACELRDSAASMKPALHCIFALHINSHNVWVSFSRRCSIRKCPAILWQLMFSYISQNLVLVNKSGIAKANVLLQCSSWWFLSLML